MMRCISWLHISDIHMCPRDEWPQKVVMDALCEDILAKRPARPVDFVLVTGDLAFSGKAEEYDLVERFLDDISAASDVPRERIFCIPGNHDIDRDQQKFCFKGARATLQDSGSTDAFLGAPDADDFQSLMIRQKNYRLFQESYFLGQERTPSADELGYVSRLTIDGVRIAIIGFDTAWLANGGIQDHMQLLLGERQIRNTFSLTTKTAEPPHIVIAMGHHPLHLLQDFDRRSALRLIERQCHFYHCGHLHEPEERFSGQLVNGCLMVAGGASFQTRQSYNTYSIVRLDLHKAERTITTHRYSPRDAVFSLTSTQTYRMEVQPVAECDLRELAEALAAHGLTSSAYYLAALLFGKKSEVPVPTGSTHTLASLAAFEGIGDSDLKRETLDFFAFQNVLRVLYGREDLAVILSTQGATVLTYAATLSALCESDASLQARINEQNSDARSLAAVGSSELFSHTRNLWQDLANAHEWEMLRENVEQFISSGDESLILQAKRMLALALASSDEYNDRHRAAEIYQELIQEGPFEPTDAINLARTFVNLNRADEAKTVILEAIRQCSASALDRLGGVGHEILASTGDRKFRDRLQATIAERNIL